MNSGIATAVGPAGGRADGSRAAATRTGTNQCTTVATAAPSSNDFLIGCPMADADARGPTGWQCNWWNPA